MTPTPFCICTVVSDKALEAILENTGAGTYRDAHPWVVAKELAERAAVEGASLPILFATGAVGDLAFSHWSIINGIEILELHTGNADTRCGFEPLQPINPIWTALDSVTLMPSQELLHREAVEPIRLHRQLLDESLIRPYAICETPAFITSFEAE